VETTGKESVELGHEEDRNQEKECGLAFLEGWPSESHEE
jgi:hypothetical protein